MKEAQQNVQLVWRKRENALSPLPHNLHWFISQNAHPVAMTALMDSERSAGATLIAFEIFAPGDPCRRNAR